MAKIEDNSRQVLRALAQAVPIGVLTGAVYMQEKIKQKFPQALTDGEVEVLGVAVKDQPPSPPGVAPYSKSGRLRGSIVAEPSDSSRLSYQIGTNVKYAAVHELGLRVTRKAHTRRVKKSTLTKAGKVSKRKKKVAVTVKAHSVKYPKRPFMLPVFTAERAKTVDIIARKIRREFAVRMRGGA